MATKGKKSAKKVKEQAPFGSLADLLAGEKELYRGSVSARPSAQPTDMSGSLATALYQGRDPAKRVTAVQIQYTYADGSTSLEPLLEKLPEGHFQSHVERSSRVAGPPAGDVSDQGVLRGSVNEQAVVYIDHLSNQVWTVELAERQRKQMLLRKT